MTEFIDLSRRFRHLTKRELEDPDLLAEFNEWALAGSMDWTELLQHPRVLLLAEAGAGKTREMNEQTKRLAAAGKYSFFVPLEALAKEDLQELLSVDEERAFDAWKQDEHAAAWFFLDAVDELKLTEGKLDRALARFAKATAGYLDRVHVVVSCRPLDWRPDLDMRTLISRLPVPAKRPATETPSDEVFLAPLRLEKRGGGERQLRSQEKKEEQTEPVCVVALLPMSRRQIEDFAGALGVLDPDTFIAEIAKQHAWSFARRPLDLMELIGIWRTAGRLGTRAEQHEVNLVAKLRDAPERADKGVLSESKARLGAERLALALALTRSRTIRSPEQSLSVDRADGVLDAAQVLSDWTESERQTLLRRALFDPATYGRVRFHHRSVQEYLAASKLRDLRDKGMTRKALLRLLFAERYREKVVVPSMRPIAAWLAIWNADVRREIAAREPETLLSQGDPESLPIEARAELLRSFAKAYGTGGDRGLNIPIGEVRRLAHPELSSVVRELWGNGPANPDVRELLLEIIWQGRIDVCSDIAVRAARDVTFETDHRITATRALVACGRIHVVRELANSILAEPALWPDELIHNIAIDLFPLVISVDELVALMRRTREPVSETAGFGWTARDLAESVEPWSQLGVELRAGLAELIWEGRNAEQVPYHIEGAFDHLAPVLARLLDRQLSTDLGNCNGVVIRAAVVAHRFGYDGVGPRDHVRKLAAHFSDGSTLRETAFWTELAVMDELVPPRSLWESLFHAEQRSVIGELIDSDRLWLETAVSQSPTGQRRRIALEALIQQWLRRGCSQGELERVATMVRDDESLTRILLDRTRPPEPNPEQERLQRESLERRAADDARDVERLDDWMKWRTEVMTDPHAALSQDRAEASVVNLFKWLKKFSRTHTSYDVWDADALSKAFSTEVTLLAAKAFQAAWRRQLPPTLWSERQPTERNTVYGAWLWGLCGVSSEAGDPGWAGRLSRDEVRKAVVYATVEMNGFASWITDLVAAHPEEVTTVLGTELSAQLRMGLHQSHLPALQNLTHADIVLKRALAPRLLECLVSWPSTIDEDAGSQMAHHLEQVLDILNDVGGPEVRSAVARESEARLLADPSGPLSLPWIRALFRLDPERATEALEHTLASSIASGRPVQIFAELFEARRGSLPQIKDPADRARILGRLVRSAYSYVRHEDDRRHEGNYSPDTRDHAETARNFLLSRLLDTPGPEAWRIVLELAADPLFGHFPDRLRLLARERAAYDAEFGPFTPTEIVELERCYELPPHDRDGLFVLVLDRLEDLAHDLVHHDFTNRRTLQTISEESEMQRTVAWHLEQMSKGVYTVAREEEVADRKRTDIRLVARRGGQKAVIEVKLADARWSVPDLVNALSDQLIGRYLRHDTCKAGCLLLTFNGEKRYWEHPETGARLNFGGLLDYLNGLARHHEVELAHSVRVAVFGIDLTESDIYGTA